MISVGTAISMTRWNSKGGMTTMTNTLPLWAALLFGVICGAVIGTIVAAFYLTRALKTGFGSSFTYVTLPLWINPEFYFMFIFLFFEAFPVPLR